MKDTKPVIRNRYGDNSSGRHLLLVGIAILVLCQPAAAQLNQGCIVSVLNRTVQVNPDGTWVLPNIPSNIGQIRARATCIQNGVTKSGQSDFFTVPSNGVINQITITFDTVAPVPGILTVVASNKILTSITASAQLSVTARFADGTTGDLTGGKSGTNYSTSNPTVATVSLDGLVTAVSSGTTIISAMNEGALGVIAINVVLSGASHDGIPDDWAIAHGLDPNDPAMPFEDPDHDGLTNLQEFQKGTDPHSPDTDGDGIPDGLEVAEGTDPLNPNSFSLAKALKSIRVTPSAFTINFNTLLGEGSRQLIVTGILNDANGTQVDLTSARKGTNYISSDLTVCNFGALDGQVFAGNSGTCTITVTNNGFTAKASGVIKTFSPTAVSFIPIPGFANNVKVNGDFAYVAAGSAGLQVVDITDRSSPHIVASLATPGNANDLRVLGKKIYLAAGSAGLLIIDISNPLSPVLLGSLATSDNAWDVAVSGNLAFIAVGPSGLRIADISNPTAPIFISSTAATASCALGTVKGVAVSGNFALAAAGPGGLQVVDVSNPANPQIRGCVAMPSGDARKVQAKGTTAFVAPYPDSLQVVDFSVPSSPVIVGTTSFTLGGRLQDVAVVSALGQILTLGADVFFVNGVPITDVTVPGNPVSRAIIDFRQFRDDNGHGIAADGSFAYMTGEEGTISDNGVSGDTRLYIGQYLAIEDTAGIPPTTAISSPTAGTTVIERQTVPVTVVATDDVAVASVSLTVNGQVVGTQTSPPYQFSIQVPVGTSTITLGAFAADLGGNIGNALPVRLNVVPDPGTTVVGRVVDTNGNTVAGATVSTVGGRSATTGSDGSFSITQVPTVLGDIVVTARFTSSDGTVFGGASSPVPPVPLGITRISGCVRVPATIVSWWPGDGNANDISGSNNGILKNGASFAPGLVGQAFSLNGSTAFVDVGNSPGLQVSAGSFTVTAWVNFKKFQGDMSIADKMSASGVNIDGWRLIKQTDNRFWFCLGGRDTNRCGQASNTVFSHTVAVTGTWYHVAAVKAATSISIYVNGVLEDTRPLPTAPPFLDSNSTDLLIGSYVLEGAHLNGLVDEVQLFNRALSTNEIQATFATSSRGNCKGSSLDDAITIVPVPVITSIRPKSMLAGSQTKLQVTGTTLAGSTFAFSPAVPIPLQVISIDPSGTSALLSVSPPATTVGTFALLATNIAGSSDTRISSANRFTIVNPKSTADSDGDGFSDAIEATFGSDPLDASSLPAIPKPIGEVESLSFSVLNSFSPARINSNTGEVDSLSFSVLNGFTPSAVNLPKTEVESLSFSVLNGFTPGAINMRITETESQSFSVLNGVNVTSTNSSAAEAESLSFSVLNGISSVTTNSVTAEGASLTFSVLNGSIPVVPNNNKTTESESLSFSLLNGTDPALINSVTMEAESLTFSVQNNVSRAINTPSMKIAPRPGTPPPQAPPAKAFLLISSDTQKTARLTRLWKRLCGLVRKKQLQVAASGLGFTTNNKAETVNSSRPVSKQSTTSSTSNHPSSSYLNLYQYWKLGIAKITFKGANLCC